MVLAGRNRDAWGLPFPCHAWYKSSRGFADSGGLRIRVAGHVWSSQVETAMLGDYRFRAMLGTNPRGDSLILGACVSGLQAMYGPRRSKPECLEAACSVPRLAQILEGIR